MGLRRLLLVLLAATIHGTDLAQQQTPGDEPAKQQTPSGLDVPVPQSCEADGCQEQAVAVAEPRPASPWMKTGTELLSPELYREVSVNLSSINASAKLHCYMAILPAQPDNSTVSPKEFARKTMREWFSGNRSFEKTVLILVLRAANRTEIVLGSRARKKMKESQVRKITRKANALLEDKDGKGGLEAAVRHAIKGVVGGLKKDKGVMGSLKSMLMPIMVGTRRGLKGWRGLAPGPCRERAQWPRLMAPV